MVHRAALASLILLLAPRTCTGPGGSQAVRVQHRAVGNTPQVIALYEAWFGHPKHISVGYSSQDPTVLEGQIRKAKAMGISAFVVDWYGDREPFIDQSYALMQKLADKEKFQVAMMYDEANEEEGATDEAIADFTMFHDTYLASKSKGHHAYLTYEGRPVIFIFPQGKHTDWAKVRAVVDRWNPAPLLIYESTPGPDASAFDGFYAWVQPGQRGWAQDGSNWGEQYLSDFYDTMGAKYPDKIVVGGAWAQFNDNKAAWGLNRHISARCGQTYSDTLNFWRKEFPADQPIPFLMIETWNDYEEGTAVEPGIPTCGQSKPQQATDTETEPASKQSGPAE